MASTVASVQGCLEADNLCNEGSLWAFVAPSSQGRLRVCLGRGAATCQVLPPAGVSGQVAEALLFHLSCVRKLFSFHPLSNFGLGTQCPKHTYTSPAGQVRCVIMRTLQTEAGGEERGAKEWGLPLLLPNIFGDLHVPVLGYLQ